MLLRRLARPLLSLAFIAEGIDSFRNPQERANAAAPLVNKGEQKLPADVTSKVPTDPETVVKINGAVQVGGGALLALGKAPRLASLALAMTVVPTALTTDDFWNEQDPEKKAAKQSDLMKNLSLLGGLMIASADTEGKPSLGWRRRRATDRASAAVSTMLTVRGSGDGGKSPEMGHGLHVAAERSRGLAAAAASRGAELADIAREHGPQLAEAARERGTELAQTARERGSELADIAREHGPQLAEAARERGTEFAQTARERGSELADTARERGPQLADAARERAAAYRDR